MISQCTDVQISNYQELINRAFINFSTTHHVGVLIQALKLVMAALQACNGNGN